MPESYLQSWCNDRRQLLRYCKGYAGKVTTKKVSPAGTGFKDGLYKLVKVPQNLENKFEENYFSQLDSLGAKALQKLQNGDGNLTDIEFSDMIRYVRAMYFRSPDRVEYAKDNAPQMLRDLIAQSQEDYVKTRQSSDPENILEALDQYLGPADQANMGLKIIQKIIECEDRGQQLTEMRWFVKDCPNAGIEYITSDNPLVMMGIDAPGEELIALPLSPTKALYGIGESLYVRTRFDLTDQKELISMTNASMIAQAHKFVYTTTANPAILDLTDIGTNRVAFPVKSEPDK